MIGGMRFLDESTNGAVGQSSLFELEINSRVGAFYWTAFYLLAASVVLNVVFRKLENFKGLKNLNAFRLFGNHIHDWLFDGFVLCSKNSDDA